MGNPDHIHPMAMMTTNNGAHSGDRCYRCEVVEYLFTSPMHEARQEVKDLTVRTLEQFPGSKSAVALFDCTHRKFFMKPFYDAPTVVKREACLHSAVLDRDTPVIVNDAREHSRWCTHPQVIGGLHVTHFLLASISLPSKLRIGAVSILGMRAPATYSLLETDPLTTLATRIGEIFAKQIESL